MKKFRTKKFALKDGIEITIRTMNKVDLELSWDFFQALKEEDRIYLRVDVTMRDNIKKRIEEMKTGAVHRIVATFKDKIIADGALEKSHHEWKGHVGEMRIIIANDFQKKGLGMIVARELYYIAAEEKLQEIIVRMMRTQEGAKNIFRKLGFHEEIILADYVKDMKGVSQDMILMKCNMKELWKEMENFFKSSDFQRHR